MGGYAWIEVYRFKYELLLYNVKSVTPNIRVDADAGSFVCICHAKLDI
jgi:hypothetical protein